MAMGIRSLVELPVWRAFDVDDAGHGLSKRANRLDAFPRATEFLARLLSR
jgi:hypothetical protein